jgi:hypothetical protein
VTACHTQPKLEALLTRLSGLVLPLITKVPQLYRRRWGEPLKVLPRTEYRTVWTLALPGLLTATTLENVQHQS